MKKSIRVKKPVKRKAVKPTARGYMRLLKRMVVIAQAHTLDSQAREQRLFDKLFPLQEQVAQTRESLAVQTSHVRRLLAEKEIMLKRISDLESSQGVSRPYPQPNEWYVGSYVRSAPEPAPKPDWNFAPEGK